MKKFLFSFFLSVAVIVAIGQVKDLTTTGGTPNVTLDPGATMPSLGAAPAVIWDNGPLINSIGTGAGGADESVLQSVTLSMNTLGFGFQTSAGNIIADDFVLSDPADISSILVYGYQTNSPTTSTINAVYLEIYDGEPGAGGNVVWGDMITNRMVSTAWTGIYRVSEITTGSSADRPIMECVCEVNTTLSAGTYWLAIQLDGSSSYSGPWCPPVTLTGQTTTGNSVQYVGDWYPTEDSGTSTGQGVPFVIMGNSIVPFNIYYVLAAFVLIGIGIVVKRRFF
ncbi:MAG: hypothetical protein K9H26_12260 [Prolixibacteraceae bacterium]|nr:hypothetical protein [Prolixibacteraceae bacterium]